MFVLLQKWNEMVRALKGLNISFECNTSPTFDPNETNSFTEIIHSEGKILSLFTHPLVVQNIYEFLLSLEHRILKNVGN